MTPAVFKPTDRAQLYNEAFPDYPPLRHDDRWIDGVWMTGRNYEGPGYYGAYPPDYEKRIMSMFPDAEDVLHLFSGSISVGPYTRFDRLPEIKSKDGRWKVAPDVVGEAEELSNYFKKGQFDLILADPPYSEQDARMYGTILCNRRKVFEECHEVIRPGGTMVWMDQSWPMFSKKKWNCYGFILIVRSTNHRHRVIHFFERV